MAAIAMATLLPTKWDPRTGFGYQVEHFLVYFTATIALCIVWRRPYVVAVSLIISSALLEALQGLTPDRFPDLAYRGLRAARREFRCDVGQTLNRHAREKSPSRSVVAWKG